MFNLISICFTNEFPNSIEKFTTIGYNGIFNGLVNENKISVELNSGEKFSISFQDIDFNILIEWDEKQNETGENKEIIYKFDSHLGVYLIEKETNIQIILRGLIDIHPIDLGLKDCQNKFNSNLQIAQCNDLAVKAWKGEIENIYSYLENKNNIHLSNTQNLWHKFIESEKKYLSSYYSEYGSIKNILYSNHLVAIYKNRFNELSMLIDN